MTQSEIRAMIMNIVHGNIRYANPADPMNVKKAEDLGIDYFTTQSAEEVLDDITFGAKLILIMKNLYHFNAIYKISKNFKPKFKYLKYLITDTNGKILKNSSDLKSLLKNTNWKKL